ncbi:MAG TPA: carboxymuconolactone decarboxylase family protein [Baekduia sp.]|nr:carboxymuconolactone decarboxylase family protein [Baekduia sp.]
MPPRVAPGSRQDLGRVNHAIAAVLGAAMGGGRPNVFTTLGRHRRLFRRWLVFAGALMPGGRLPRADSELLILRVAHRTGCAYEWHHHERLGRIAGLTPEDVTRVRSGPDAPGWTARRAVLLRAADELLDGHAISDATWAALEAELDERQRIELPLLVGHYAMLAGALNALQVQPDAPPAGSPSPFARVVQAAARRRGAA